MRDLSAVRSAYKAGEGTLKALAERFSVPLSTVKRRASKEEWRSPEQPVLASDADGADGGGKAVHEMEVVPENGAGDEARDVTPDGAEEVSAPCIPDDINELGRFDAARFYVENLGWTVHPLYGPRQGKPADMGKHPILKGFKQLLHEECTVEFLARYFAGKKDYNVGLLIREGYVHVDLDSKEDKGESVRKWLAEKPSLAAVPRERTGGGAHLVFRCDDLPEDILLAGNAPCSKVSEEINAELIIPGLPLVASPSVHPSGHQYHWEVTGEIPRVTWDDLCSWFGFKTGREERKLGKGKIKRKDKKWQAQWRGDLRTLNLKAVLEELEMLGECLDADTEKWAVKCPWVEEHSGDDKLSVNSGTIIFNPAERMPAFCCLHSHCRSRNFESLAKWIETRAPGLIETHCEREREWREGHATMDGRPQIILPGLGRLDSEFAAEVGKAIGPRKVWFNKAQTVCAVEVREISETITSLVFNPIQPVEAVTAVEDFIEPGKLVKSELEGDVHEFKAVSMTRETAGKMIAAPQFKKELPKVVRILDIPMPIKMGSDILIPERGYDPRFRSYLPPDAPQPVEMGLEQAIQILHDLHSEFCWKDEQSVTHALARIITPFCRGLMGWEARFPLWHFAANRPRAGKDFLAGVTQLTYEGYTCEDAPIDKDSEETRKRITAALMAGRRVMHFANNQGYIKDQHFIGAITSKVFAARNLGSTEAKADLVLPNEIEFSISANIGLTFREDVEPRTRRIALEFYDENENGRIYKRPDLHGWVLANRPLILGAVAALVQHWIGRGCPPGTTPFNSFPEWASVVGGIMTSCGLGDPCRPHKDAVEIGGDRLDRAMRAVYGVGFENHPDEWIDKSRLFELLDLAADENDDLGFFAVGGDLTSREAKTRIGKALRQFKGRHLDGIQLLIDDRSKGHRQKVMFAQAAPSDPVDLSRIFGKAATKKEAAEGGAAAPAPANTAEDPVTVEDSAPTPAKVGYVELNTVPAEPVEPEFDSVLCRDRAGLEEVVADLTGRDRIALDVETYGPKPRGGLDPFRGDIRLLTLSRHAGRIWILDLKAIGYDLGPLKPVLEQAEIIAHNAKFDLLWLREKCGLHCWRVFCTMTAARLMTAGIKYPNRLDDCLERYLDIDRAQDLSRSDWSAMLLTPDQIKYAARDVAFLHDLAGRLEHHLEVVGLDETGRLEMELLPCVVDMEASGIGVDRDRLKAIVEDQSLIADEVAEELRDALEAPDLNPDSPDQLVRALRKAGLKIRSTAEDVLKKADDGKLVPLVLKWRAATKRARQAKSFLDKIAPDGRIHGQFDPTGAGTGRFSSKEPNLQNIGRGELREAFVPAPGHKFVVADYSQIELRIAAVVAGEEKMIEAYKAGTDLHALTAASVLGIDIADVDKEQRQLAKAVNFGVLYGQAAPGLARYAGNSYGVELSVDDARKFRGKFFAAYRHIRQWHGKCHRQAKNGILDVRTRLGRRRKIPASADEWECFTALVNTPVQGGAADGMKQALVLAAKRLPADAHIIATVHDELVVECPEEKAEEVRGILTAAMTEAMSELYPEVPIEVEASIGDSWADK